MILDKSPSHCSNACTYLPLANHGAELVRGHIHAVEVGEAVLALDLVNPQLDLTERVLLVLVQVGERNLENTALQGVISILQTLSAVDQGLADLANIKGRRSLDIIPILASEGIDTIVVTKKAPSALDFFHRPHSREKSTFLLVGEM